MQIQYCQDIMLTKTRLYLCIEQCKELIKLLKYMYNIVNISLVRLIGIHRCFPNEKLIYYDCSSA